MIDVKSAVDKAKEAFLELMAGREYVNLTLEEVEISEDEKYWSITLGYDAPVRAGSGKLSDSIAEIAPSLIGLLPPSVRHYKVFRIRADDGKVLSMKIRVP